MDLLDYSKKKQSEWNNSNTLHMKYSGTKEGKILKTKNMWIDFAIILFIYLFYFFFILFCLK